MLSSVGRYAKQGIYVAFFKVPKRPKKVTEGSIRRLKQVSEEWKYITGRGGDASKLPKRVSISEAGILKAKRDLSELNKLRMKEEDLEELNRDNEDWTRAREQGYIMSDIPDMVTNEALQFYEMAQDAIMSASLELSKKNLSSRRRSYWKLVLWRGNFAVQGLDDDLGVQTYSTYYSFNLRESKKLEQLKEDMQEFLYDSGSTQFYLFDGITETMTTEPSSLSMEKKRQLADIKERMGLT